MPCIITKLLNGLYRWLPIICGCHCREDRSFHYKGRPFPVCARCTGEVTGVLAAVCSVAFWHPPVWVAALLLVPMVADGVIQARTSYESTNPRRFVTGLLFGYGLMVLFLLSLYAAFSFGASLGERWFH